MRNIAEFQIIGRVGQVAAISDKLLFGAQLEGANARLGACGLGDRGLTCKLVVDEQVDDTTEVFVARNGAHLPSKILRPHPMDLPVLIRKTDSGWYVTTLGR